MALTTKKSKQSLTVPFLPLPARMRRHLKGLVIGIILTGNFAVAVASIESETGFNPGEMIFHHVLDNYEWHILSAGNFHLTIHLPVIIYHPGKGLVVFSSRRFAQSPNHTYREYRLTHSAVGKPLIEHTSGEKLYDLSITKTVFCLLIAALLTTFTMIWVARRYQNNPFSAPRGLQSLLEPVIIFIRDEVARPTIGEHKYLKFTPYLLSAFFFILFANLLGLLPLGINITGNISVTATLAAFTFLTIHLNATKHYWAHIFNTPGVPWWLKWGIPLMPIIEVIGVISKHIALAIRLFANILGGHMNLLALVGLIFLFGLNFSPWLGLGVSPFSVAILIFMYLLELLVAFIQAYVFTMLSAVFIGQAVAEEH